MAPQWYTNFLHCFKNEAYESFDDDYESLASSPGFRPLNILRYYCNSGYLRVSIIDEKSEKECNLSFLKSLERAYFVGCCNGLALFTSDCPMHVHVVVDPLSAEIMPPIYGPYKGGDHCGFFFHPLAKEYRILSVRKIEDKKFEYQIYLFGSQKWRKIANPYFEYEPTTSTVNKRRWVDGKPAIRKRVNGNPAILNDALHWDMDGIMVFDMITEELSFKDAPFEGANYDDGGEKCLTRRLLVDDDRLYFCFLGREEPLMDIWVLEDYAKWSWTKKYTVDLNWDMTLYPMERGFRFTTLYDVMQDTRIVGIQNNELVLYWKCRGMFSYHLGSKILRKIHLEKSAMDQDFDPWYESEYEDVDRLSGFEVYSVPSVLSAFD